MTPPSTWLATHAGDLCHRDGTRRLVYLRSTGASWRASDGQRYNTKTGARKGSTFGDWTLLVNSITRILPMKVAA